MYQIRMLTLLMIFGSLVACSVETSDLKPLENSQNQILQQLDEPYYSDLEIIQQLESLGYLGGHDEVTNEVGIRRYLRDATWNGYNLVVSGHGPDVDLMNMDGTILHTWSCPRNIAFPPSGNNAKTAEKTRSFRRARVLPNGDLLGIYNGTGMVRLNWNSDIVWTQAAMCHHDLAVCPDGRIFTFVQKKKMFKEFNPVDYIYDEYIVQLDSQTGKIVHSFSLIEAFSYSNHGSLLKKIPSSGDIFHANTLVYIDSEKADLQPIYHTGHLLISLRNMDAIAIVNPESKRVQWAMLGLWSFQHEPSILENGNMLVFDNTGHGGHSKVIEFNPITQKTIWTYSNTPETPLYSSTSGACYRLPNGNTLIIESNRGRAFEVLPAGDIVWEYVNMNRWGADNHLVATLFDVQRIPVDYFDTDISYILNTHNSGRSHTR
jgi:hypothetical protein